MPEGPIIGLNAVGKWLFELLLAAATIALAINLYRVIVNLLRILGVIGGGGGGRGEEGAETPLRQLFKPAIRSLIAIVLMIVAVRAPQIMVKDAESIDSIFSVGWNVVKGIFSGFGETQGTQQGSTQFVFANLVTTSRSIASIAFGKQKNLIDVLTSRGLRR